MKCEDRSLWPKASLAGALKKWHMPSGLRMFPDKIDMMQKALHQTPELLRHLVEDHTENQRDAEGLRQ